MLDTGEFKEMGRKTGGALGGRVKRKSADMKEEEEVGVKTRDFGSEFGICWPTQDQTTVYD